MDSQELRAVIINSIKKAVSKWPAELEVNLEIPPNPEMGDLGMACFDLAKKLNQNPVELAKKIAEQIRTGEIIEKATNIGPYLNIFFNREKWFNLVCTEILEKRQKFGLSKINRNRRILIEYSAPNSNKPQHLGHLRNNLLGMSVANLLSATGAKVIKVNLVNDRGIHICKSMLAYQKWGNGETPESKGMKGDHFVGKYYSLFGEKSKEELNLLKEAQEMLEKWEAGDSAVLALWQKMNQWAIRGLKETYQKLGVEFDHWYFESETYKLGREIVLKALKKKKCYRREDGAIEIDLAHANSAPPPSASAIRTRPSEHPKENLGKKVLIRADGTSVYITQDIGLAKLKNDQYKPDLSIYVVASEQNYHFKVLFKVLEKFGFKWAKKCYHFSYGLVFLPEGKMKSREGKIVEIDDLLAEMEQLAKGEISARQPNISPTELTERAKLIALGALKFFFLKSSPEPTIHFKPKESIAFEGATGPYLQYTYARIKSILNKQTDGQQEMKFKKNNFSVLNKPEEIELLKLLFEFPEVIKKAASNYNPSILANYLLKLAQVFNEFYHLYPVLKAENLDLQKARLVLIEAVAQIIKNGLNLLGVQTPERM